MSFKLFLDDQSGEPGLDSFRSPPKDETDWKVAHSSKIAIDLIDIFGLPTFIDFDCDLGNGDSAMVFCKWLFENYSDAIDSFEWSIHSQNVVERENLKAYLDSWKKSRTL